MEENQTPTQSVPTQPSLIQNPSLPTKSFLKSHRFSWGVIGFLLGLPLGYGIGYVWVKTVEFFQPNLELGIIFGLPALIITILTPFLTYSIGYNMGKEIDYPEEKEFIKIQSKKKFIKGSLFYIVLLILLFFLWPILLFPAGWVIDFFSPPRPVSTYINPTPTISIPTPTTNPTANWKTYKNEVYSFSFKYPNDWKINGQGSKVILEPSIGLEREFPPGGEIEIIEGSQYLSPQEYALKYDSDLTFKAFKIDDVEGVETTPPGVGDGYKDIFIMRDKFIYHMSFSLGYNSLMRGTLKDAYDQILQTFRFSD